MSEAVPETPQSEEQTEEHVEEETSGVEEKEEVNGEAAPEGEEDEEEMTVDLDALPKMKVGELKDILKALDLPTTGIKTTLIERIQEHFAEEDKQDDGTEEKETTEETSEEKDLLKEKKSSSEFIELNKTGEKTADSEKTEEDKKKERAEKFGISSEEEKKEQRAAKFGIDTDKSVQSKKEERAKKFGIETQKVTNDKKAERAARFGTNTPSTKLSVSSEDKAIDDEKLNKRKARFNLESEPTAKTAKLVTLDDISEKVKEKIESGATEVNLSSAGLSLDEKKKLRALKFGA